MLAFIALLMYSEGIVMMFCTVACGHRWLCSCRRFCHGHWQGFHRNFICCYLRLVIYNN